jgi:DNA-binding MarR family transcriptional regulator
MSRIATGRAKTQSHRANIAKGHQILSDTQAREVRALSTAGFSQTALAERFSIGQSQISRIIRGEVYRNPECFPAEDEIQSALTLSKPSYPKRQKKLSDDEMRAIRTKYASGEANQADLAREYGVSQPYVSGIVRGKK